MTRIVLIKKIARRCGARFLLALLIPVALVSLGIPSRAAIYAYTDAQGRIRITDIPEKSEKEVVLQSRTGERSWSTSSGTPSGRTSTSYPAPDDATKGRFHAYVREAAQQFGLAESLIYAVIKTESNFNPYAVSRSGALGLMQLMPSTARLVGVKNAFDPHQNILGGSRYLRMMLDRFGRLDHAIAAYNAGPEAVQKHRGIPPYSETRNYVPRVMKFYREFSDPKARHGIFKETRLASSSKKKGAASSTPASSSSASVATAVTQSSAASAGASPLFYYRGPDGQIYITNLGK